MPHNAHNLSTQQTYLLLTAYLTPIFMSVTMFFALFLKKHVKSKADRVLGFVLLAFTGIMMLYMLKFFFFFSLSDYPIMLTYNLLYSITVAPLVYFYFVALLHPNRLTLRFSIKHFIPSVVFIFILGLLYLTNNAPQKYYSWQEMQPHINLPANVMRLAMLLTFTLQRICYIIATLIMLYRYQRSIKSLFSYTEGIRLNWIYFAVVAYLCFTFSPILAIANDNLSVSSHLIFTSLASIYVLIIFFAGYYQPMPTIYTTESKVSSKFMDVEDESETGSVSQDNKERLKSELLFLFENKKCFLNQTLSVEDIASELGTNRTYVSKILNEDFGTNFYAFVNRYRLAEFIKRLHESKNPSLLKIKEVSIQVGFKSYTSFFNSFREQTGYTPSDYIKIMLDKSSVEEVPNNKST